jgi:hypothetical protein
MSMSSSPSSRQPDEVVLQRLDELEAESARRRRQLGEIATQLPHAVSRRGLARAALIDLRRAPAKRAIAGRGLRKLLRGPAAVIRRLGRRTRPGR